MSIDTFKSASELNIGEVIEIASGPYMCGTVIGKNADFVSVFRPYVHISESAVCDKNGVLTGFKPTIYGSADGGERTICYTGAETVKLSTHDTRKSFRVLK